MVALIIAVIAAIAFNSIVSKFGADKLGTKAHMAISLAIDVIAAVVVGIVLKMAPIQIVGLAILAIAVADLGYDTVIKLIKVIIVRLKGLKEVLIDKKE